MGRMPSGPARGARLLAALLFTLPPLAAAARMEPPPGAPGSGYGPDFGFVTDGSTVMDAGEINLHLTNWGLIGSTPNSGARYADAPSCQWPAGSGNEYLYAAALWVGGRMLGQRVVSMGGPASEWLPRNELEATVYEAVRGELVRPLGNPSARGRRAPDPDPDDDDDGLVDEDRLDGHDNDGDGRIDEDFGQIGTQMMVTTTYDNTRLASERFPDHTPMNLEMVQRAVAWENDTSDDFIGFDYTITNVGVVDVEQVYIGFFADADVGPRSREAYYEDDMAGSWRGMVRGKDGSWVPVDVGFMYDAAESGRIDGYFGVVFLDHDVDPTGRRAPTRVGLRTFQNFSGALAFEQGGDPVNDEQAYQLLSAEERDWDADTSRIGDYRYLVSAGPFVRLEPGESLGFRIAIVCGAGLGSETGGSGLLANCAEAWLTHQGIFVDELRQAVNEEDETINPGRRGRETLVCRDEFGGPQDNPFDRFYPDFMDTSCLDPVWLLGQAGFEDADLFELDGRTCAMVNMDNCFECARQLGRECTTEDFESGAWNCNDPGATDRSACTGVDGYETQITWLVGMAPPPPGVRLWPTDGRVHVFWDDRSEHAPDVRLQRIDFESYRIWRADNWSRPFGSTLDQGPASSLWQLLDEFDVVNVQVSERRDGSVVERDTVPLGRNTGLADIAYRPRVLDDPAYAELGPAMARLVATDNLGRWRALPSVRLGDGTIRRGFEEIARWETERDVLDTFFAVTPRAEGPGVKPKRSTRYYEYVDRAVHNGFLYFYSVSTTDHLLAAGDPDELTRGPGLAGDPGSSARHGTPGTAAQTPRERARAGANIYVYPNPATRAALADYQQFDPTGDDPTGVRVTFANLPAARNTVRIYTVSGDLVQTLAHDGRGGAGHLHWNLMSRNGQEIVSGVYLYAVQSDDRRFDDFVGKFTVVR